jgi:hypothetical protein
MFFQDDEDQVGLVGDAVAGVGVGEGAGFAGAAVASAFVPRDEGFADVDDGDFDCRRALGGGVLLGGREEFAAEARVLLSGADGQGAEVPLFGRGGLEAYAALESGRGGVLRNEIAGAFGNFFGEERDICALAGDVFAFDAPTFFAAERGVHEGDDGGEIGLGCRAEIDGHFLILWRGFVSRHAGYLVRWVANGDKCVSGIYARDLGDDRGYRVALIGGGRRGESSGLETKPAPF